MKLRSQRRNVNADKTLHPVAALTGSRQRPLEIDDSDDDASGFPTPPRNLQSRCDAEHVSMGDLEIIELTESETEIAKPAIPRSGARKRVRDVPALTATKEEELENRRRKLPRLDGSPRPKSEPLESGKAGNARLDDISLSHFGKHFPKIEIKEGERPGGGSAIDQQQLDLKPPACEVKAELLPQSLDELRLAVSKLSNPKAEVKKERRLDADTVLNLLPHDALQPYRISLPEELRSVTVSRLQLSKRYGGSPMDTFPHPNANKVAEHGYDNFMCISLEWNPNGPQIPGHGGLFFKVGSPAELNVGHSGASKKCPAVKIVFVKLGSSRWLYLGQYEVAAAPALTAGQWSALPDRVRNCWTKNIWKKSWATEVRARIHLRRTLGREPTQAEVDGAAKEGKYEHIQPGAIHDALVAGRERIQTWSMKCIGYDEDFQKGLVELARKG